MKYSGLSERIEKDLKTSSKEEVRAKFNEYLSEFPTLPSSTFDRMVRRIHNKNTTSPKPPEKPISREKMKTHAEIDAPMFEYEDEIIGVIGDAHEPYCRPGYYEFCYDIFKREGVTTVCQAGDLVDNHCWSRFNSDPYAMDGVSEFQKAFDNIQIFKEIFKEFPKKFLTLGNHDKIPMRQAATLGLPSFLIRSFKELFKLDSWEICYSKTIDGVEYRHGEKCTATLLTAQRMRKKLVCAHSHSKADIQTHANWESLVWGMHVGCGVDDKLLAFAYGADEVNKSIISCATVKRGSHPQLHFMDID